MIIKDPRKAEKEFWNEFYEEYVNTCLTKANGPTEQFKLKVFGAVYNNIDHSTSKCSKKCSENPNCLEDLKLENWETDGEDVETVAVGIKNLGATCYLNTLLQIWFYNPAFRRGIYTYPLDFDNLDLISRLQTLFAELQLSKKKFINAEPLVEMLQLQPAVQQDALEFSKLLTSLLEDLVLQKNTVDSEGDLARSTALSQYKGEHIFVIECSACHTKVIRPQVFYELEISLPEKSSLKEGIQSSLRTEVLDGDNKYMCRVCNSKQEAIRSVRIRLLPKTINFQVNRFIFDSKSYTKKKSNADLSFPLQIDMAEYVEGFRPGRESWYYLSAVLLHRGSSANSGHYIARVYDHERKVWLDCDDECVTSLDPIDFEIDAPDEDFFDAKKKRKASAVNNDQSNGIYHSNSCYLLVYEKKVSEESEYSLVPEQLRSQIEVENKRVVSDAQKSALLEEERENYRKSMVASLKDLYSIWNVDVLDPTAVYVSKDSLATALELLRNTYSERITGNNTKIEIDSKSLMCSHGKLDPQRIIDSKRLSIVIVSNHLETKLHKEDLSILGEKSTGKKYLISKSWFSEWKKRIPFDGHVPRPDEDRFKSEVFCIHGARCTNQSSISEISARIYKVLQTRFPRFITLSSTAPICEICLVADNELELAGNQVQERESELLKLRRLQTKKLCPIIKDVIYFIIPEKFIEAWRLYIKRSNNKVAAPSEIDTFNLLCQHEKLICNIPNNIEKFNYNELPNGIVIDEQEFTTLTNTYTLKGPKISLIVSDSDQLRYSPDFCLPCRKALKLDYKKAKITITKKETQISSTPTTKRRRTITSKPSSKFVLVVEPQTTIHQLKLELMEKFQAPPFYQKLFLNGRECANDASMSILGIYAGAELELEVFEESGHEFEGDCRADLDVESVECGFQGTMLSGWRPAGSSWTCSKCTLVNNETRAICEVCEEPKP